MSLDIFRAIALLSPRAVTIVHRQPVLHVRLHLVSGNAVRAQWPPAVRKILREEEDGTTVAELAVRLGAKKMSIASALTRMPDTYIDRWTEASQQRPYEAIWCIVTPPEDCPKPTRKKK